MKLALLTLVFFSLTVLGQPVEGPFLVWTTDSSITQPEICVRDSEADILYVENNSVHHARFSLVNQQLTAEPISVFTLQGWNTEQLHDLVCVNDSTWACLVYEDELGRQGGSNDHYNSTYLLFGDNESASFLPLDSGDTRYYYPFDGDHYNEGFSLAPRIGGGVVTAWLSNVFHIYDYSCGVEYMTFDNNLAIDFHPYGIGGMMWNPTGNRAVVRSLTHDSSGVIYGAEWNEGQICTIVSSNEYPDCYRLECEFPIVHDFGLTNSRNYLALTCSNESQCTPNRLLIVGNDTMENFECYNLGEFGLSRLDASFWHRDYGFAALKIYTNHLELARIDTNGAEAQPVGTVYWADSLHQIFQANLTINDDGRVVVLWSEYETGSSNANTLKIASVYWNTPLDADEPSHFNPKPSSFTLSAYPNPFNLTSTIHFEVPKAGKVLLDIFELNGRLVQTLLNENLSAGEHKVNFDGSNLSSGIYFARLKTLETQKTIKLTLIK